MMEWTTSKSSPFRGGAGKVDSQTLRKASMKKLTAMMLTLCFSVSILGCTEDKATKKETKTATTTSSSTPKK